MASDMVERDNARVAKITSAQKKFLHNLIRFERGETINPGAGNTNMTGCALARMSLAEFVYRDARVGPCGEWRITDAGRAALQESSHVR